MVSILIIEDEEQIRGLLAAMLEEAGYHVMCAGNGAEGLRLFEQKSFDLVITDIMMPEKDGIETIRELKRESPQMKIIAITGYRGRFNRLPAAEFLGAELTLMKPFTRAELLGKVHELLPRL